MNVQQLIDELQKIKEPDSEVLVYNRYGEIARNFIVKREKSYKGDSYYIILVDEELQ